MFEAFKNYANYLWFEIKNPEWGNYFYGLITLSLIVYILELVMPWRKKQSAIRKDFWLDLFYLAFNFFLFNLFFLEPFSSPIQELTAKIQDAIGINSIQILDLSNISPWLQMLFLFVYVDFIHWNLHRLLHRFNWLWQFHKVHHSVKEMGFAAHFRFHWFENIYYKSITYIPLALIGVSVTQLFVLHMFTVLFGHLNHANLSWSYGVFGRLFNNPKMHIWHHSKELPSKYGVNFGLTLSIWDYIFKTAYIPKSGKNIELGFPDDENFPKSFTTQAIFPITRPKNG